MALSNKIKIHLLLYIVLCHQSKFMTTYLFCTFKNTHKEFHGMDWFISFRSYKQIKTFWGIIHFAGEKKKVEQKSHKETFRTNINIKS